MKFIVVLVILAVVLFCQASDPSCQNTISGSDRSSVLAYSRSYLLKKRKTLARKPSPGQPRSNHAVILSQQNGFVGEADWNSYINLYLDVRNACVDPAEHYITYGYNEGRMICLKENGVSKCGKWDDAAYLRLNPDVLRVYGPGAGHGFQHYKQYGYKEPRLIGITNVISAPALSYFVGDADWEAYLALYEDVAKAGVNPAEHYKNYGFNEGRLICVKKGDVAKCGKWEDRMYLQINVDVARVYGTECGRGIAHYKDWGYNEPTRAVAVNSFEAAPSDIPSITYPPPCQPITDTLYSNEEACNRNHLVDNCLQSSDGKYRACMQTDGNFVVYGPTNVEWASNTVNKFGPFDLIMQNDGNLVVYGAAGRVIYSAFSVPFTRQRVVGSVGPYRLVMQTDGNLVVYDSHNKPLWDILSLGATIGPCLPITDALHSNQQSCNRNHITNNCLQSSDGRFQACMQTDGNFVVYSPVGVEWASNTVNDFGPFNLIMQDDGNLVVYGAAGRVIYSAFSVPLTRQRVTGSVGPYILVMQTDGNLVVYDARGKPIWDIFSQRDPTFWEFEQSILASESANVCDDVGMRGECCFNCNEPTFNFNGREELICNCPKTVRFRWHSVFQDLPYPCYPLKTATKSSSPQIFQYVDSFLAHCRSNGCNCRDIYQNNRIPSNDVSITLYPGNFPPSGPLTTTYLVTEMTWLRNRLQASKIVTGSRKLEIMDIMNYLFSIYDDPSLARTTDKTILKDRITVLLSKKNTIIDTLNNLNIPITNPAYSHYATYYRTCLSEIYRISTFFMNRYRYLYPGDNSYYM